MSQPQNEYQDAQPQSVYQDVQQTLTNHPKVAKGTGWVVEEDVALMSSWISVSEGFLRGTNKKCTAFWQQVIELFEEARVKNPEVIRPRNLDSARGRFKRLNDNVNKWIAAHKEAYRRKKSGMIIQDIEAEAHTIYEASGCKFSDLHVFELMRKHSMWEFNLNCDATITKVEDEGSNHESHGSSKRLRTIENTQYVNPETPKGKRGTGWLIKEDVALMSSWISVSENFVRGYNKKSPMFWKQVANMFEEARAKSPEEINPRNLDSMRGRFKRLNDNVNKWIAANKEAYRRKKSGKSITDVEAEAHTIYEAGGCKFVDLHVFEVMRKHSRWELNLNCDATITQFEDEGSNQESHGSSKRLRTNENIEYINPEAPNSDSSTIPCLDGKVMAEKEPEGKTSQTSHIPNEFVAETRALRLAMKNEVELMNKLGNDRLELERMREDRKVKKMHVMLLNTLLAKNNLSEEDEELKRRLKVIVFGN